MSDVSVWHLFAYMDDDETGRFDERRRVSEWQLQDTFRWCVTRGYDHVYFSRDKIARTRYSKGDVVPVRHHMHLVEGSEGERGDSAA